MTPPAPPEPRTTEELYEAVNLQFTNVGVIDAGVSADLMEKYVAYSAGDHQEGVVWEPYIISFGVKLSPVADVASLKMELLSRAFCTVIKTGNNVDAKEIIWRKLPVFEQQDDKLKLTFRVLFPVQPSGEQQ